MQRFFACIVLLGLTLPVGTSAGETATEHAVHSNAPIVQDQATAYQRFTQEMDQGMEKMMSDMHHAGHSSNPDLDFLAMMIPHHQGAVDMARLQLINGRDPLTRKLAEEIVASQTTEIEAMRARLEIIKHKAEPGGFPPLDGTRGERE